MAVDFYGTATAVKRRTGVRPGDLGLEDDAALDSFIEELLDETTDLIDRRLRRTTPWKDEDTVPAGLNGIASDIVADTVRTMVQGRQTPVVRVDDFAVKTIATRVFSPDVEKRLKLYASNALATLDVTPGDISGRADDVIYAADLDTLQSGAGEGL